jgi:ketosteroid isomerase-like protein
MNTKMTLVGMVCLLGFYGCSVKPGITQQELVRRTQELADAVGVGNKAPWQKYYADDCLYFDEKGRNMNKQALVADITPLPQGYSGKIVIENPQSHIQGDVAFLSYDQNETETIYGQELKARYHETDTWLLRNGEWKIAATQVLRYYEDPAPGAVDVGEMKDYVGTYQLAPGQTLTVSLDAAHLYRQRDDGPKVELIPEAPTIFFRKGVEGRILFRRDAHGKIDTLIDRRNNEDVVWKRV